MNQLLYDRETDAAEHSCLCNQTPPARFYPSEGRKHAGIYLISHGEWKDSHLCFIKLEITQRAGFSC